MSIFLIFLLAVSFTLNSFLYPQIYFEAFEEAGVYEYVDNNLANDAGATFIKIPPEGSKPLVESLFSNLLAYMRSDTDTLNLYVTIDQEKLRNFFLDSMGNITECRQNQDPFDDENPCLPRGMTRDQFLDVYLASKNLSFFESDQVDLTTVYGIEPGSEGRQNLDNIRNYIKYYQMSSILLIVIVAVTFLLIFLLQKPDTRKSLRTFGKNLIIPSLMLATIVYSINNLKQLDFPDPLLESLFEVVKGILTNKLIIFSSIAGVLGLFLVISSFAIKNKDLNKNQNTKVKFKK